MFFRVRADLPFTSPDEARDFYHDCEIALPKAVTLNPGMPNEEKGHILLEKCYHDEDPNLPCEIISEAWTSS